MTRPRREYDVLSAGIGLAAPHMHPFSADWQINGAFGLSGVPDGRHQ